ncbi:hypothetical protein R5W24_000001 [Gemmata sp. JC717]|uniref:hypothetical protein n=1 Tax=Gemmata algarum TaxID=2975278 RepID=UPI0021BB1E48|nr:hypothetical protein [Gemmata algarum]MDY3550933.1 hypothetical protein [Gemmata algarum]
MSEPDGGALPPVPSERRRKRPVKVEPEAPPETKSAAALLPFIADLVAFVVLIGSGMLLGELLVRKSTGQVLSEAGSAPKFPPVELLLWAAPPVMLALMYLLLSGRKQSFGAWVRRRTAK